MKFNLFFFLAVFTFTSNVNAQDCPFDPTQQVFDTYNQTVDNSSSAWQQLETNLGNCNAFYVVSGNTYEWSLCDADGASFPTTAKIIASNVNEYVDNNFDENYNLVGQYISCGGKPKVIYNANFTGNIYIEVLDGNCTNGTEPGPFSYIPVYVGLRYRSYNCATTTASVLTSASSNICQGSSVLLSVNAAPGAAIQWQLNGQEVPFAITNSYYANIPGAYNALVSLPGSDCAATASNSISLSAATASISFDGLPAICASQPELLNANTGTGLSYEWLRNGVIIPGALQADYSATEAGLYKVIIGFQNCISSDSVLLTLGENPPNFQISYLGSTTFCEGGDVLLESVNVSGYTYQWLLNGQDIPQSNYISFSVDSSGLYSLEVTNPDGCQASSTNTIPITVLDCAKIDDVISTSIDIHPNPAIDFINLQFADIQHGISVSISDVNGRIIFSQSSSSSSQLIQIPVANLTQGLYILHIVTDKSNLTSRFFKNN
jgi:hypothetical protein